MAPSRQPVGIWSPGAGNSSCVRRLSRGRCTASPSSNSGMSYPQPSVSWPRCTVGHVTRSSSSQPRLPSSGADGRHCALVSPSHDEGPLSRWGFQWSLPHPVDEELIVPEAEYRADIAAKNRVIARMYLLTRLCRMQWEYSMDYLRRMSS